MPDSQRYPSNVAAVVHLNFRSGSTFPVPVCNVSPGHRVNQADGATRLTRSDFRLNLLLLKGQRDAWVSYLKFKTFLFFSIARQVL